MHQARPYGLSVKGGALDEGDIAFIDNLARRLTNAKDGSGLDSLKTVRTLPGGGYVVAQDMGGIFRVFVHKTPEEESKQETKVGSIPMLFSGLVTKARLSDEAEGAGLKLTETTRRRLIGYKDDEALPPKETSLMRFRVPYHPNVQEFSPDGPIFHTQYAQLRPGWYSGAMAEVVQIAGGYGRQDLKELPKDKVERARFVLPNEVRERIETELSGLTLPGYTGEIDTQGRVCYDYKFHKTEGVGFDPSGAPWLVRVGADGVFVMPLPLIPASTTKAFRAYIEKVEDGELLSILDRFGGMPSGETFPTDSKAFAAWKRAGVIHRLCDTQDFYDHSFYSSACGWAFNASGTEGFNTCYDYDDEAGIGYGLAYKLTLRLANNPNSGRIVASELTTDPKKLAELVSYIAGLRALLDASKDEHRAILYKLCRQDAGLVERAGQFEGREIDQAEVDYWNNREFDSVAPHSGRVSKVGKGWLYHPAKFKYQPQIKFPEPSQGGCVSHDFSPLLNGRSKSSYPRCDTIMAGYYIGDDLKVVKYFWDQKEFEQEVDSSFEDCMIVGSWTETRSGGKSSLHGNFYTSDFDERKTFSSSAQVTTIEGRDLGYDSTPFFQQDEPFSMKGSIWRNRYASRKTNIDIIDGRALAVGICIPYFCRNAVLHAKRDTYTSKSHSESVVLISVEDPTSYRFWTYDFIFAWAGGNDGMPGSTPKDGNPVWVGREMRREAGGCSDFADGGSWISVLADYTWLIHPNRKEWNISGGGGAPKLKEYAASSEEGGKEAGSLMLSLLEQAGMVNEKVPDAMYFLGSPSELLGTFYRDATRVWFGGIEYANVSEYDDNGLRRRWGKTELADHKSAHHFIGVIHE